MAEADASGVDGLAFGSLLTVAEPGAPVPSSAPAGPGAARGFSPAPVVDASVSAPVLQSARFATWPAVDADADRTQASALSSLTQDRPSAKRREAGFDGLSGATETLKFQSAVAPDRLLVDSPMFFGMLTVPLPIAVGHAPAAPTEVSYGAASSTFRAAVAASSATTARPVEPACSPVSISVAAGGHDFPSSDVCPSAAKEDVPFSPEDSAGLALVADTEAGSVPPPVSLFPLPVSAAPVQVNAVLAASVDAARVPAAVPSAPFPAPGSMSPTLPAVTDISLVKPAATPRVPASTERAAPADVLRVASALPWRLEQPVGGAADSRQPAGAGLQLVVRPVAQPSRPGDQIFAPLPSTDLAPQLDMPAGPPLGTAGDMPVSQRPAFHPEAASLAGGGFAAVVPGASFVIEASGEGGPVPDAVPGGDTVLPVSVSHGGHPSGSGDDRSRDEPVEDSSDAVSVSASSPVPQPSVGTFHAAGSSGAAQRVSGLKASVKVAEAAADAVFKSRESGARTVVSVEPEGLGRVSITVERGVDGVAAIHVSTERLATLEILRNERADLSQMLDKAAQAGAGHTLSFSWDGSSGGRQALWKSFAASGGTADPACANLVSPHVYQANVAHAGLRAAARGGVDVTA